MSSTRSTIDVQRAQNWHGLDIAIALTEAFFEDPIVTWMLPVVERRSRNLLPMFSMMAESFLPHGEVRIASDAAGAALWLPPGAEAVAESEAEEFATAIEKVLGPDAPRAFELLALMDEHHPHEECYYLQLIGVVPAHQGRGLGSQLMAPVLAQCDARGVPAYLEATTPDSRRLYQHLGFEVTGEIATADSPPMWPMWREPQPQG